MTTLPISLPLAGAAPLATPSVPTERSFLHRASRIALYVSLSIVSLLVLLFVAFHAYIAWSLSHPKVASLAANPFSAKNLEYSDIIFASSDGSMNLDGWWVPSKDSRKTVVLSHGYGANREESWVPMYDLADFLHGLEYNVLMFDYGFASASHRMAATGGRLESLQLLGAIQYARDAGSDEIVVWGFSMGAGTALQAALRHAPVDAMILDSTFLPDENTIYHNMRNQISIPKYPSVDLIRWFFPIMSGGTKLDQIPAEEAQQTAFDFPIFLIHGTADEKAPVYLSENVAKAQKNPDSRLWVVPDALHEMIFRMHPEEYTARTTDFLSHVHAAYLAKAAQPHVA
ncbi:alpha/beta hydrolase [Cohnella faecalis]|uniref:Alpha/beta fold hydrolase n=1 Tax=Cohnella faecalis TaxID=2315694 RepID=A0A398CGG8_9BACL|nr:alpha/beta fold hydrolase [Cohnella faecalis]RIE02316.1 alpha/beta fold hydrolase [Cohnella faecalis]